MSLWTKFVYPATVTTTDEARQKPRPVTKKHQWMKKKCHLRKFTT